jgi:hypothetical protein
MRLRNRIDHNPLSVTLKLFASLMLIIVSLVSHAQEPEEESKNEVSIFLGATSNEDATVFALGFDYQYKINHIVGVGALVDYAMGNIQSLLIAPAVYLHAGHFEVTVAPAAEFSEEGVTPVLRVGAAYEFKLASGVSISPSLFFDTERHLKESLVYGLSFGFEL